MKKKLVNLSIKEILSHKEGIMDLIIKNATLEEITSICYKIGEPNFEDMAKAERKYGVVDYLVKTQNKDLNTAIDEYDSIAQESGPVKESNPVQEKVEPVQDKQNELHLEEPPKPAEAPVKDLEGSLKQLATELVEKKGAKNLIAILNEFGAKSVPELNKSHYEEAISKIKEALNGPTQ